MYEEPSSPVEIDSLIPFIRVFTSNFLYLTKLLFQKLTPWPILTIQFCITTKKKKKKKKKNPILQDTPNYKFY